jgi:hypothetical protein
LEPRVSSRITVRNSNLLALTVEGNTPSTFHKKEINR